MQRRQNRGRLSQILFQRSRDGQRANPSIASRCGLVFPLFLVAGVLVLLLTTTRRKAVSLEAATVGGEQAATVSADPPGTVDGSKNPELIPDEVAYRLFFLAVAEPQNASDDHKARARAKLNPTGLDEQDTETLLGALAEFRSQIDPLHTQAVEIRARSPFPHPDSTDWQQLKTLGQQRDKVVRDTVTWVPTRLTPLGRQMLDAYLQEAKRGMKIIPATNENLMPSD